MTEALKAVLTVGFEGLKVRTISACYATWNKASERFLVKNGFQFVRYQPEEFQKKRAWVPENEVQLTAEKWRQQEACAGIYYVLRFLNPSPCSPKPVPCTRGPAKNASQ